MAEFTSRDKTIASLLCWGWMLAFVAVLVFVDEIKTVERIGSYVADYVESSGIVALEIIWFACLAVSLAIMLWGHRVRAGLLRVSPPWLGLAAHWLFCIHAGILGFVMYISCMLIVAEVPVSVLTVLQCGVLSVGFILLCLVGLVRPLPEK